MQNLDMTTKELVKTYVYDDINSNRQVHKQNVVNGRTVIELGTRPATVFVGNLYKVFDLNVKSFKYLLMVGVARQNVNWNKPINKEQAEELAMINCLTNPFAQIVLDEPISNEDFFYDIGIVFSNLLPHNMIKTDEDIFLESCDHA